MRTDLRITPSVFITLEAEKYSTASQKTSEISSLRNIFFDPASAFKSLQTKPHFITAGLILIILSTTFQIVLQERLGVERLLYEQLNAVGNPVVLSSDRVEEFVATQNSWSAKTKRYLLTPIGLLLVFAGGGFFYWVGIRAFGKLITYKQALSVWVYSSFAPGLVFWALNLLVLFLKPIEEISYFSHRRGVIALSLSTFLDLKGFPVLATVLSSFDLFYVWGLMIAAIGIKILSGLSTKSTRLLIISTAFLGLIGRVLLALITHLPQ